MVRWLRSRSGTNFFFLSHLSLLSITGTPCITLSISRLQLYPQSAELITGVRTFYRFTRRKLQHVKVPSLLRYHTPNPCQTPHDDMSARDLTLQKDRSAPTPAASASAPNGTDAPRATAPMRLVQSGAGRATACETVSETGAVSSRWHESMQVRVRGEEVHLVRVGVRVRVRIRAGVWVNVSRIRQG